MKRKQWVNILIGFPASGKTTYAEKLKSDDTVILSSDLIRKELYGDESIQGNPKEVFDILYDRMKVNLKDGKNIVIDATNICKRDRAEAIRIAKLYNCFVRAIEICTSIETCKKRNTNRERKVPDYVYNKMLIRYEAPTVEEGFDIIKCIRV